MTLGLGFKPIFSECYESNLNKLLTVLGYSDYCSFDNHRQSQKMSQERALTNLKY